MKNISLKQFFSNFLRHFGPRFFANVAMWKKRCFPLLNIFFVQVFRVSFGIPIRALYLREFWKRNFGGIFNSSVKMCFFRWFFFFFLPPWAIVIPEIIDRVSLFVPSGLTFFFFLATEIYRTNFHGDHRRGSACPEPQGHSGPVFQFNGFCFSLASVR